MTITQTITVNGPSPYDVSIGHRLSHDVALSAKKLGASTVAIIHQPALAAVGREIAQELTGVGLSSVLLPVPDAEAGKTLEVAGSLWDACAEHGIDRKDAIIGLGGGAATDLAGFVAATWMRGIPVIQVPTTLLGMVDAAVGGKTGINTAAGKNLVGSFHEPSAVFIDMDRLYTLDPLDVIAGSAEIIKTGFIADEKILELYETQPEDCLEPGAVMAELIGRSVQVKADVVSSDLKESGLREILNYGHTFGHAVEQFEDYTWRHGDAVAVGMMFIAQLAHARGLIDQDVVERHHRILESVGLPTSYKSGHFEHLLTVMGRDKKNRGGKLRFVALDTVVGKTTRIEGPSEEELRAAYESITD